MEWIPISFALYYVQEHSDDAIHIPANGFTLFTRYTGGSNRPRSKAAKKHVSAKAGKKKTNRDMNTAGLKYTDFL